jgi:hypothetical protein
MENSTKPNDELDEREAEATDKETLEDLQEAFGDEENTPEDQVVPNPDGAVDQDEALN